MADSTASAGNSWTVQLASATVTINGLLCPLSYASPSQINALVPDQLQPGTYLLTLQNSHGQTSTDVTIEPVLPALFTYLDHSTSTGGEYLPGTWEVAALDSSYHLISLANPAVAGQTIALFATGLGATTKQGGLAYANVIPDVRVDGVDVPVTFAGRAPGYQSLDQINIQIPNICPIDQNAAHSITIYGQQFGPGQYTYISNTVVLPLTSSGTLCIFVGNDG